MRAFSLVIIFSLSSFGLFAQGWFTILPDIPNTPSLIDRISFIGFSVNQDSIYAMVNYEYGASNVVRDYVVLHGKDGELLDYFQTPTVEAKDRNIDAQFLFTSNNLAIHTFYTFPQQKEIIECVNVKTKNVEWSKDNLTLVDCVSDFKDTYSTIFCHASNGDYVFLDKQTGNVLNTFSADSLSKLIGSYGQRDSVFEISRIAGNDSIQYFFGFITKPNGDRNVIHAKYEKSCACVTDEIEFTQNFPMDLQKGFEQPLYTVYDLDHQAGDSIVNANIRMFNFSSDTIISEDIVVPAFKGLDSAWTEPRVRLIRGFDNSYVIESNIIRDDIHNGRPETQGGHRFQFHNATGDLINITEAFFSKAFSTRSILAQNRGQFSYVLRPDSSATIAFRSTRELFATIGYVNFNKDGISPLNINKSTVSQKTIQVYPNPFKNNIFINNNSRNTIINLSIYNPNGQLVKSVNELKDSSINLTDLPLGIYQLRVLTNNNSSTINLIKN